MYFKDHNKPAIGTAAICSEDISVTIVCVLNDLNAPDMFFFMSICN